jgi:hypothetical protein
VFDDESAAPFAFSGVMGGASGADAVLEEIEGSEG